MTGGVDADGGPDAKWPRWLRLLFVVAASLALWAVIILSVMLVAG